MRQQDFDRLVTSIKQAGAIRRGRSSLGVSRRFNPMTFVRFARSSPRPRRISR